MTTRYKDGSVTVTLSGELEAFVRRAADAAAGATIKLMESEGQAGAQEAAQRWYSPEGVTKQTGRSGRIQSITTISPTEVRVSVGSTDTVLAVDRRGKIAKTVAKPRAVMVHRPGNLATVAIEITEAEYRKAKETGGIPASLVFHARTSRTQNAGPNVVEGKFYRKTHSPLASDGAYLIQEFVRKPMKTRIKRLTPEIGRAISDRMKRGA